MDLYCIESEVSDYLDDINDHMNILNEVKEQYSIAKSKSIIVRDSDYHLKIKRFEENLLGSKSFAEYSKIIGLKSMYNSVPVITPRVLVRFYRIFLTNKIQNLNPSRFSLLIFLL